MLPILTECSTQKAEGFLFLKGGGHRPVRSVPLQALIRWQRENARKSVEGDYGTVSKSARGALLALTRLLQVVQSENTQDLVDYVQLKAATEVYDWRHSVASSSGRPKGRIGFWGSPKELSDRLELALQQESVRQRLRTPGSHIGELIRELSYKARPAVLVLWWVKRESRLAAGLYCPNFETALHACLLSHAAMPEGMAVCVKCMKVFRRARVRQKFCSKRCGNAVRQRRHRSMQKNLD
jgi:hypothetical protein